MILICFDYFIMLFYYYEYWLFIIYYVKDFGIIVCYCFYDIINIYIISDCKLILEYVY